MKGASLVAIVYGLILLVGGVMGFVKAASLPSLITGGLSGILFLILGWKIGQGSVFSTYSALGLVLALDAFFTYRFISTGQMVPAGMMMILSTAALLLITLSIRKG